MVGLDDGGNMLDRDGYPTEEALNTIKTWNRGDRQLFEYIQDLWWPGEWGFTVDGDEYRLATGGWSGNEDIIGAMQDNFMFWMRCWMESHRGGLYVFRVR